eukprot:m.143396 g.143396  ORF g.143396 m.143396 type:complete len:157 (-) comp14895_c0_seq24:130-600(-)
MDNISCSITYNLLHLYIKDNPMFNESRPPLPPTPISTNVTPVRNPNQPPVTSTPYYSTPSDPPPQSLIKHARNPNYSELSDAAKYNQSPSASSRGETPFYSTLDDPDGTMYNTPLASPSAENEYSQFQTPSEGDDYSQFQDPRYMKIGPSVDASTS